MQRQVSVVEGIGKACELGAAGFFEVSAKTGDSVEDLFQEIGRVLVENKPLRRRLPPIVMLHTTPSQPEGLRIACTSLGGTELLNLLIEQPADLKVGDILEIFFPRLALALDVPQWMLRLVLQDGTILTKFGLVQPNGNLHTALDRGMLLSMQLYGRTS